MYRVKNNDCMWPLRDDGWESNFRMHAKSLFWKTYTKTLGFIALRGGNGNNGCYTKTKYHPTSGQGEYNAELQQNGATIFQGCIRNVFMLLLTD
jgi:hypothetical protein